MNRRRSRNTDSKDKEIELVQEAKPEQLLDTEALKDDDMMQIFASDGAKILISKITTPSLYSNDQINSVINKLANYKQTSKGSIIVSLQEFFRQGGANASISPLKKVKLICPEEGTKQFLYAQKF
jgi:hypothetical protein